MIFLWLFETGDKWFSINVDDDGGRQRETRGTYRDLDRDRPERDRERLFDRESLRESRDLERERERDLRSLRERRDRLRESRRDRERERLPERDREREREPERLRDGLREPSSVILSLIRRPLMSSPSNLSLALRSASRLEKQTSPRFFPMR